MGLAQPGIRVGLILAGLLLAAGAILCLKTGLGPLFDTALGLLLGILLLGSTAVLIALGLVLVRRIPLRLGALIGATAVCLVVGGRILGLSVDVAVCLGGPGVLLFALAGAGLSVLRRRDPSRAGAVHAILAVLLLGVVAGATAGFLYWLAAPGADPFQESDGSTPDTPVALLDAPNPSETGPYAVATLFYGSGTDRHRREYGPSVDLKTSSVNASPFVQPVPTRFGRWARKKYWGFEPNSLPLNARVWFPKDQGAFPLVLIVHGNHRMERFSDPGYAYLGALLASRGFIVASVDENFLNDGWAGGLGQERGVRGWLLLKHLELWRAWNEQEGNPFHGKVDLENIALIGHSRGGEAIVHAAMFNRAAHYPDNANVLFHFGFDIKTLIALAPIEGRYRPNGPAAYLEDINYLVLQGSHDADVCVFAGARRYRLMAFPGPHHRMKAALYIHRANHSQFNTVWGRYDEKPPLRYLLNRGPLLDGEDQRTIAKVYASAFLEVTLHGDEQYLPLFRDPRRAAHWLPATRYISRFQDSDFRTITDFDGPGEVTQTTIPGGTQQGRHLTVWERQELLTRLGQGLGDHAVVLGWNRAGMPSGSPGPIPSYAITLPDILPPYLWLDERMALSFCLADTAQGCGPAPGNHAGPWDLTDPNEDRAPIDMTVELVASNGRTARLPLSHCRPLPRAIRVTFSKWRHWERVRYGSPVEPVLQTFEIPLVDFAKANPGFAPALLTQIRFLFDRTRSGVIILDQVGMTLVPAPAPQVPGPTSR